MTAAELARSLQGHLLVHAGRRIEGPYDDEAKERSVVYVYCYDGTRLRVEVSRP